MPEEAPNSCEGSVNGTDITFINSNIFRGREVALAPRREIGDKALFAVNLCSSDDFEVIRYSAFS